MNNKIRQGIIISFNKKIGVGFIKDANGQKIRFHAESTSMKFAVNDLVGYVIGMVKTGLVALNITLITSKFGEVYRFKSTPKQLD